MGLFGYASQRPALGGLIKKYRMSITIIGGNFKGRKLKKIDRNISVRPILARIKKSLFDIIRPKLEGKNFLDLYSGSGTVGIEALSRAAKFVVFIDSDKSCIKLIKTNLIRFGLIDNAKVSQANVLDGLDWLRYKKLAPFEIIFLGPPYKDSLVNRTLKVIERANILSSSGWIVAQHHKKENVDSNFFLLFRQKKYGDTILSFFSAKSAPT
jgi:16S rRNA (guanine(966)-N(2))-methyltransferase RsmD